MEGLQRGREQKLGSGERKTRREHRCLFSSSTYSGPKHEVRMNLESDYLKTNPTEMIFDIRYVAERGS